MRTWAKHPWDIAKRGPRLVINPGQTPPVSNAGGLASYGRKEITVGGITVIAPSEMVIIDATLKELPNLYDGLPRSDKIIYLMSLLDVEARWKTACTIGIGLSDLRGDQLAVYRSICPPHSNTPTMWSARATARPTTNPQ